MGMILSDKEEWDNKSDRKKTEKNNVCLKYLCN
jgi:hypothetical protein